MPYICVEDNRYIGEHDCGNYHYGDQSVIRPCCVLDAKKWKEVSKKVALTPRHPAYSMFRSAYSSLTDMERGLVGDLRLCSNGNIVEEKIIHVKVYNNNKLVFTGTLLGFLEDNQFDEELLEICKGLLTNSEVNFSYFSGEWRIRRLVK